MQKISRFIQQVRKNSNHWAWFVLAMLLLFGGSCFLLWLIAPVLQARGL